MKLTARQDQARSILNGPAKHILLDGGSRSGKTFLIVRNVVLRALKAPKSRHAIMRFRFKHCKEAIGMDTLPNVLEKCFPGVQYDINKHDWYFPLPNRSEIWLAGLDDKERTEKVLGKEFATIYLNECSQIPLASRNIAVTRLAQRAEYEQDGEKRELALKMYYDENPPSKAHWSYALFHKKINPETKLALKDPENYATLSMNPEHNRENLPADYIHELENLPERMKKRFLYGEYGEAAPNALFTMELFDQWRASGDVPQMVRVVVAVDPSGASEDENQHNDEIGIIVAGLGIDGNAYVLEDLSCKAGPKTWGNLAVTGYDRWAGSCIVAETNYGGEMVKYVVETSKPGVPFKKLTASKGKWVRAEPIAALVEQGKVRMAGAFHQLEDELCAFTTHGYTGSKSPNRGDAFVWAMTELFPGVVQQREKDKPLNYGKSGIV